VRCLAFIIVEVEILVISLPLLSVITVMMMLVSPLPSGRRSQVCLSFVTLRWSAQRWRVFWYLQRFVLSALCHQTVGTMLLVLVCAVPDFTKLSPLSLARISGSGYCQSGGMAYPNPAIRAIVRLSRSLKSLSKVYRLLVFSSLVDKAENRVLRRTLHHGNGSSG
jgi:hypothetical protein